MTGLSEREKAEARERLHLCSHASFSNNSRGRKSPESLCEVRPAFQRDCHRIVHSKAFRRLRGKTQVFLWPKGDHYRTRLTHCLEVAQIARTIARALDLNEDLTEAIALGHDLGHAPFGHAGEAAMQKLVSGGFRHEQQSLRVVERLENEGRGLNLTYEVLDGIARHSKGAGPLMDVGAHNLPRTLEGQVVRLADIIAYVNHDLDDAMRAKVIEPVHLPRGVIQELGQDHSSRITRLVLSVIQTSCFEEEPIIRMDDAAAEALTALRAFLYEHVYFNEQVHAEFEKASTLLERLWAYFLTHLDHFYTEYWSPALRDLWPENDVRDFLAGMTDAFAVNLHETLFAPRRWYVY